MISFGKRLEREDGIKQKWSDSMNSNGTQMLRGPEKSDTPHSLLCYNNMASDTIYRDMADLIQCHLQCRLYTLENHLSVPPSLKIILPYLGTRS